MIATRQATAADAAAIRALTREAYAKWVAVTGREPLPMRVDYDEAVKSHRFDLLYDNDTLAALIETAHEADHVLIVNVAVAPSHQKRGLGRQLLALAETIARDAGLGLAKLYTNGLMAENIALYRRLGYRIDREEPSGGHVQVHMSKAIGGRPAHSGLPTSDAP
ncbi:MAG: GNAT family N-acetyltransferase [Proteobacteria bacterium]|nr:GNAT family N-acetyltransferase [Pseudomonadota bacterium]